MSEQLRAQLRADVERAKKITAVIRRLSDGQPDDARIKLPLRDVKHLAATVDSLSAMLLLNSLNDMLRDLTDRRQP